MRNIKKQINSPATATQIERMVDRHRQTAKVIGAE
jgi:hypothetical protein